MDEAKVKVLLGQCHHDVGLAIEALKVISYACTNREDLFSRQIKKLADEAIADVDYKREWL